MESTYDDDLGVLYDQHNWNVAYIKIIMRIKN